MQKSPLRASFASDIRRSVRLLQGFRGQYEDQDGFYTLLAEDTVSG